MRILTFPLQKKETTRPPHPQNNRLRSRLCKSQRYQHVGITPQATIAVFVYHGSLNISLLLRDTVKQVPAGCIFPCSGLQNKQAPAELGDDATH